MKQQLAEAKERFLSAIEEQQTSREESQNTTEEALSANEELQSLNEELETAKEELQSTNEELITVNDELQAKNAALAQARDFAMSIVETVRQPLLVLDTDLRIRMANRAFYRTFQVSPLEAEGQAIYSLSRGSWDLPGLRDALDGLLRDGNSFPDFEVEQDFPGVGRRSLVLGGCRINHLRMILLAVDDITERKLAQQALRKSEEHLRQSQKMEAVGRLAGGIAHDFNNLLTAIIGYSALLCDRLAGDESAMREVLEIKSAGERAASLTQQLLAFSRRQVLQPKVLDLNAIVADFDKMLRRLVGERIRVAIDCEPDLWQVRADPGEIGRAIMNLSLNARDAMPEGGTLTVETANVTLTEADAANQGTCAGALRDDGRARHRSWDGCGGAGAHLRAVLHDERDRQRHWLGPRHCSGNCRAKRRRHPLRVATGRGNDLHHLSAGGRRSGGYRARVQAGGLADAPKGSEVVLLVEDEDAVRKLARMILETGGYTVLDARNGREGLALCEAHEGPIDLLVTDVVMPELGGRELAEGALKLRPGMKVLFMSGHTQDVVLKEGVQKGAAFLQKPFTPAGLAQKVRETLDSRCQIRRAVVTRGEPALRIADRQFSHSQVQHLPSGGGECPPTPRRITRQDLRIEEVRSGPSRAKEVGQADERKGTCHEDCFYRNGRDPRNPRTKRGGTDSGIAKSGRHRHREERGPNGRDSVRVGTRSGDSKRGPRLQPAASGKGRIATDSRRQLWNLHRLRIGDQPKTPRGRAMGGAVHPVPGRRRSGIGSEETESLRDV